MAFASPPLRAHLLWAVQIIGNSAAGSIQAGRDGCIAVASAAREGDDARVSSSGEPSPAPLRLDRRHPVSRRIIASWRSLIAAQGGEPAGEPTLVACSGGADSTALSLALASAKAQLALAFARHGARPSADVDRDQRTVEQLAEALGADFLAVDCAAEDGPSPSEADMRRNRYASLANEARRRSIRFVASAHHADDQMETVLMALLRGSGLRGMAGVPASRPVDDLTPPVMLIRPMLNVTRQEVEDLCRGFGVHPPGDGGREWAEDRTNSNRQYARNRIRHEVAPLLERMYPGFAQRVSRSADLFRQMSTLLRTRVREFDGRCGSEESPQERAWPRSEVRALEPIEIGELLRSVVESRFDRNGLDRLDSLTLMRVAEAVRDRSTEPRTFEFGDGLSARVLANRVTLTRKSPA